jgi:hypothetical protein
MIDTEQQLRELFESRAASARPEPDLQAVIADVRRVPITSSEPRGPSPRRKLRLVAAAVIVAGLAAAFIARYPSSHTSPSVPVVTYPDKIPPAPLTTAAQLSAASFYALSLEGTSIYLETYARHDVFGSTVSGPEVSPWRSWTPDTRVVDTDGTSPGGFYIITCCNPGGIVWRNGAELTPGTHIDFALSLSGGASRVIVDPATSTINLGLDKPPATFVVPGAIDVALVDSQTVAVLVDRPTPTIVITQSTTKSPRRGLPLPAGQLNPCAIVGLEGRFVVLVGAPSGADPCIGDRALVIDAASGTILSTIRFPASVRTINSDHRSHVIAVTVDGEVVLGDFATGPSWITLLEGQYLSAALW